MIVAGFREAVVSANRLVARPSFEGGRAVLARLFKSPQWAPIQGAEPRLLTADGDRGRAPRPSTVARNSGTQPDPSTPASKRRRKRAVQVGRLYPTRPPEPRRHAKALLEFIQDECPHLIGKYVPHVDLDGAYREFCEREGWTARHWTAIARQLGEITDKKTLTRNGERFRAAYRIPKPDRHSRPLPAMHMQD